MIEPMITLSDVMGRFAVDLLADAITVLDHQLDILLQAQDDDPEAVRVMQEAGLEQDDQTDLIEEHEQATRLRAFVIDQLNRADHPTVWECQTDGCHWLNRVEEGGMCEQCGTGHAM